MARIPLSISVDTLDPETSVIYTFDLDLESTLLKYSFNTGTTVRPPVLVHGRAEEFYSSGCKCPDAN
jgi:hypothetical protein